MSYEGGGGRQAIVRVEQNPLGDSVPVGGRDKDRSLGTSAATMPGPDAQWPRRGDGSPDFEKMTSGQRGAYDRRRLKHKYG